MGPEPGRDEFEIPVFDADGAASGSRTSDPAGMPGRRPGRARSVGIAVAALVLLTAGIAMGGILEPPAPSESPSPSGPLASVPVCVPVATNTVPAFALRATGSQLGFGGAVGYTHRPGVETPGEGWQVPIAEPGRSMPEITSGAPLELYGPAGICFRYIVADYADAALDHVPDQAERRPLVASEVTPPGPNPGFGTLPEGDWVVRVRAYFETGVRSPDGLVIAELYFRIRAGSGPLPTPTPEDVELVLTAPGSEAVAGVPDGAAAPLVSIPVGELASLSVTGNACARSWTIEVLDAQTGVRLYRDAVLNPNDDPGWISQNRWGIRPVIGSYDVIASLHFGPGVDVVRGWRIIGRGFTVPDTFLVAASGARVRAVPGCGLTFTLANGYSAQDPCEIVSFFEPIGVARDDLPLLRVPAWSRVTLEIPGWTIRGWTGACGQIETDLLGVELFNAPDCYLGGYEVTDAETSPAPAQFLARPGEFVMELRVHATGSAGVYDVRMYALVSGR